MFKLGYYKRLGQNQIKNRIIKEGFEPVLISNEPGDVYNSHSHPQTKLLAILSGSMKVKVAEENFELNKGDRLVIEGNKIHCAAVGNKGCTFFWSEKML